MYLHFREANHHKWRKAKHLVEPEPDAPFRKEHIDLEGAQPSVIPEALDGRNVFEHSESHEPDLEQDQAPAMEGIDVDAEQLQARAAADAAFADEEAVADLFMDFEDDAADAMVTALTRAGVAPEQARIASISMNQRAATSTFLEVYGRSIRDQSLLSDKTSISRVWMHWTYAPQNPTASHGISQR